MRCQKKFGEANFFGGQARCKNPATHEVILTPRSGARTTNRQNRIVYRCEEHKDKGTVNCKIVGVTPLEKKELDIEDVTPLPCPGTIGDKNE